MKMKKLLCALLAAALVTACFCLAEEGADPAEAFAGRWADPYYGRATLTIMPGREAGGLFDISIVCGSSASSSGVWLMTGVWDAENGRLEYENGVMKDVTYDEQGVASEEIIWDDAVGFFALDGDVLLWNDSREERSAEFRLQKIVMPAPEPETFARDFFGVVAGVERGTAGSSLKMAIAARDVVRFALDNILWTVDAEAMRGNLLAAWESLSDSERDLFGENFFDGVAALIDEAFSDYASVEGLFEDAGAGEDMRWLAQDRAAAVSWEALLGGMAMIDE